ncbi:hypothetical protein BDW69DRAFT_183209 [Aspergillus filifer]
MANVDIFPNTPTTTSQILEALTTSASDLRTAFEVNSIAPLLVFQVFWPLLQKATIAAPKAVFITSSIGSTGDQEPVPGGAYGASRAAGNWLIRAIHVQHEADKLVAIALHPGWVQTRTGNFVAEEWGYAPGAPETVENIVNWNLDVMVASASSDGAIRLWDTATGDEKQPLKGHGDSANAVAFSPDGQTVASTSSEGTIQLWDLASGAQKQIH